MTGTTPEVHTSSRDDKYTSGRGARIGDGRVDDTDGRGDDDNSRGGDGDDLDNIFALAPDTD